MTADQYDAYAIANWLRLADAEERLQQVLRPPLTDRERAVAQVKGCGLSESVPSPRSKRRNERHDCLSPHVCARTRRQRENYARLTTSLCNQMPAMR